MAEKINSFPTPPGPLYKDPDVNLLWDAIAAAETNHHLNPDAARIRTKAAPRRGISTGYGPVQLTQTKYRDYAKRFPLLVGRYNTFFNMEFAPNYKGFIDYSKGRIKDPRFAYGGRGKEILPLHWGYYRNMTTDMMRADDKEARRIYGYQNPDKHLDNSIRMWRGVPRNKDPRYYNKVRGFLYKQDPQLFAVPEPKVPAPGLGLPVTRPGVH